MFFDLLLDQAILVFPILVFGGHDIDQGSRSYQLLALLIDLL